MVMRGEYLTKSLIEMFKVGDLPAAIRVIRPDIIKNKWIFYLDFILYIIVSI